MSTYLPAMGSHEALSSSIERQERLLTSALLLSDKGSCAVFLSEDDQGDYLLRCCEGLDERWMQWREQRRIRSSFGRSYADALAMTALARLEHSGWRVEWHARRADGPQLALAA